MSFLMDGIIAGEKKFPVLLGPLWNPMKDPWRSPDPTLKTIVLQYVLQ